MRTSSAEAVSCRSETIHASESTASREATSEYAPKRVNTEVTTPLYDNTGVTALLYDVPTSR